VLAPARGQWGWTEEVRRKKPLDDRPLEYQPLGGTGAFWSFLPAGLFGNRNRRAGRENYKMKFGYLNDWTLSRVIRESPEILLSKVWLFVALDSNRGEKLRESFEHLKNRLPESAGWTGLGIRLEGHALASLVRQKGIFVPYSAAYVVDEGALELLNPYTATAESGTFETTLPDNLAANFLKPGVHAYFADRSGLNYCLANPSLASFLAKMRPSDDWRLTSQEKYLKGVTLQWRRYTRWSETWDHDHCASCWDKFMDSDAFDVVHEGYATEDSRHWICETCFEDFKDMFEWRIADARPGD
jgi:hypothetical protein